MPKTLRLRRQDFLKALRQSNNSTPGPDGIPFRAWRACPDLAATILHEVAKDVCRRGTAGFDEDRLAEFTRSLMFCLSKSHCGLTEDGAQVYAPEMSHHSTSPAPTIGRSPMRSVLGGSLYRRREFHGPERLPLRPFDAGQPG